MQERTAQRQPDHDHASMAVDLRVHPVRAGARLPRRQTPAASGYDLHACLGDTAITIGSLPVRVPTGIAIAAPPGADVQVRPRSGLSARGVIGTLGTIDADYRGEIYVTLYCLPGTAPHVVHDGDRIAQLVVGLLAEVRWSVVDALDETTRGSGGHGSTGT